MLGSISLAQENITDFSITFQIPDNCFYNVSASNGCYTIAIRLNPGQTQPSTSYINCKEPAKGVTKQLVTQFEQYEYSGNIIRKPKGSVDI